MNVYRTGLRSDALLALVLFALAFFVSGLTRERGFEGRLNSDEPEWIAISIHHWRQFAHGDPPAGLELDVGPERWANPWKQGVQRTTFGYMNPCLPKLVWGAVLEGNGYDDASPLAFQVFHRTRPAEGRAAQEALLPAENVVRNVVVALSAISAVLLFFAARALAVGLGGWVAAATAFGFWFASPLVQNTSSYIRTDYFMVPFCLAGLVLAQRAKGASPWLGVALGVLCGLSVSSKLNGGLLCVATATWCLLAVLRDRSSGKSALVALSLAAAIAVALFYALNPRLWTEPIEGVRDMLARWDKLMAFFQDELAPRTGVQVARTLPERIRLFVASLRRDLPLGVVGVALASLGGILLVVRAWRGDSRVATVTTLAFIVIFTAGTIVWLPLDWERFYLTAVPGLVLLQTLPIGVGVERAMRRSA